MVPLQLAPHDRALLNAKKNVVGLQSKSPFAEDVFTMTVAEVKTQYGQQDFEKKAGIFCETFDKPLQLLADEISSFLAMKKALHKR